jgi:hypothetical protein
MRFTARPLRGGCALFPLVKPSLAALVAITSVAVPPVGFPASLR